MPGRSLGIVFGTLRGQLILGVALLNAVLMTLFVWYLTDRQQQMLLERQTEYATALTNSIATSSSGWLAARDYSGLQEIIEAQRRYPDLLFAMILDMRGQVLAHSDPSLVGNYLTDMSHLQASETRAYLFSHTAELVDVVSPVVLAGRDIGWVRVGLGQETTAHRLRTITHVGILNAFGAVLIASFTVAVLGWRLTRRLYAIQTVADAIQGGERQQRVRLDGEDEAAKLGQAFDAMLDTLVQREDELQEHRDHLEEEVRQRTSELRRQQAFSQAVLENINDGIVACDGEGTLSYFNRATRLIHGIDQEDLPPERWAEHYRLLEEDGATPMATERIPLLRAFRGEAVRDQPMIIAHADGSRRFMLCSGQPMFTQVGEKLGAVVSLHDVTVQKRAEAELIMARDAAEAANQAKSLFLANMSHELRTPLNAILGFSSMLGREPNLTEAQRENVAIINRSGEHLLALINDVLEIAKIESGRLRLDVAPLDLGALVRDVAEMMRLRAEQKGLSLELDQSSQFPRYIKADEARLRQILVNLVGNAVKFTEKGGVVIRLGVKGNHRHHLLIEVEDTGPGIRPEDRQRLFQPFQQLADGAKQGGTGLGLAITRQFVQMMDGSIGVDSEPGRGSCFRVDLPLEPASEEEVHRLGERMRGEVAGLAPGQPAWRILIAEDQQENRMLLERLMADLGLQAKTAENGEECIRVFGEWQPQLIWMDRRMPVMDGVEATRRIRALPGGDQVKIVAVTASVFKEQQPELIQAGMDDLVRKPYRAGEIYDCMTRQLGARFVYRDDHATPAPASPISRQNLAALPAPLRLQLRQALESLDSQRIALSVQQVSALDPLLGAAIARLVEYYDYPAILHPLSGLDGDHD